MLNNLKISTVILKNYQPYCTEVRYLYKKEIPYESNYIFINRMPSLFL